MLNIINYNLSLEMRLYVQIIFYLRFVPKQFISPDFETADNITSTFQTIQTF